MKRKRKRKTSNDHSHHLHRSVGKSSDRVDCEGDHGSLLLLDSLHHRHPCGRRSGLGAVVRRSRDGRSLEEDSSVEVVARHREDSRSWTCHRLVVVEVVLGSSSHRRHRGEPSRKAWVACHQAEAQNWGPDGPRRGWVDGCYHSPYGHHGRFAGEHRQTSVQSCVLWT